MTATVTIGMPVRNGAEYVEEAIRSLLAQTEKDFILHISDNCSDDKTPEICARLAAEDARIHYERQTRNLGAAGNFEYLLRAARTPFFMWAAHDDTLEPDFLAETLGLLGESPDAIGAVTAVRFVDHSGLLTTVALSGRLADPDPIARARAVHEFGWHAIYGLFRRERLPREIGVEDVFGSDSAFVLGLTLHGRILTSGQVLSVRRVQAEILRTDGRLVWEKALGSDGHLYSRNRNAMCLLMLKYAWGAPIPLAKKAILGGHIARTWWWQGFRREALHDSRLRIDAARRNRRYLLAGFLALRHAILRPGRALSAANTCVRSALRR